MKKIKSLSHTQHTEKLLNIEYFIKFCSCAMFPLHFYCTHTTHNILRNMLLILSWIFSAVSFSLVVLLVFFCCFWFCMLLLLLFLRLVFDFFSLCLALVLFYLFISHFTFGYPDESLFFALSAKTHNKCVCVLLFYAESGCFVSFSLAK